MRSSLLPRSASAFCTCSILYFVSAGLAAGEGGGRSPGQEQHLKNGVIEKLNNAKGDLIEISKHIGGAQTLGLSKDSMEEIRSAAQGMLSVIHDNKKRRAQDILQGTIEHLAGRPSEFINGVKTAIVAAKMVLPKDDPSILSAQQVVKNAEENQRDENINGKTTKHAKQPNRGNHRHSISADAQKAKATDVRPSDDWQMHDSTSNFTDDDGLINATNSTANAIANAEITEPSNTTSVGQMFQWLSCLAVAIVSAAMPIIWRSERTRSEFEFEDTGHKRAEEIHRKSAIAVAKAMANERREKEANANRRRKQKRRENQGAAGYEVEDESNMVNVNNLAAPSTRGTKFHTLHQLETEENGWEVAGGKFAKDKTHTQSTSSDRQPKDIPKTNQVDATQNLTTGRQAAAEKSPRKYATTEKTQTSELKAATQKKNSKTAATDKKQNRDAKAKNNASNRKAMSSTASNREAAKFSTMTLSGTGSSPQQSSRQAKPPERQHMRSAATSDKQDAQSQTRKKVGETKPAKSSRELKPPAHRGPKKNGNGSVTRPSSAQKPPRDNVVTVSAPQKKQPPRGWNVGNLVPQLVIDKTKPAAHKMLSPANALHVDSNKSKESRVKTSGSSLSSTPQSPGILFGSFDQWDTPNIDSSSIMPTVEAPIDDVSLVAVEKVSMEGVLYLVDKQSCEVYDFEDGLNEVLDPQPIGRWDPQNVTIIIF